MLQSYVLRLVPSALAEGRLAGTLQTVETGHTTTFSSADELLLALLPQPRTSLDGVPDGVTIDLLDAQRMRADRPGRS